MTRVLIIACCVMACVVGTVAMTQLMGARTGLPFPRYGCPIPGCGASTTTTTTSTTTRTDWTQYMAFDYR